MTLTYKKPQYKSWFSKTVLMPNETIKKVLVDGNSVVIHLENGVELSVTSNPGYFHLSLSGIDYNEQIQVGPFHYNPELNSVKLANYVDVSYKERK